MEADLGLKDKPAIETCDLTKGYGDFLAVDHLNFQVNEGEIFGFLGPNGSGKTTTIRMLVGLSKPSKGSAKILGYDIRSNITRAKRYIGVVPDTSNLYDELSAKDNLHFMAKLYGVPRNLRESKADELLRAFGLYDRRNDRFGTFSRGMKRSLTVASALIHDPKILFLDEPTTGLDVVAARSLRNLISNLHDQGLTIFLTTHYLEEADRLCDRIAILVKGKIVKVDTTAGLKGISEEKSIIEVTFAEDIRPLMGDLAKRIDGAEAVHLKNGAVRIVGGDPSDVYDGIFQFSRDSGVKLTFVNSMTPSLEDAFVRITGLSPTVMAIDKGRR